MPRSNRIEYSQLLPEKSSQVEEADYCNYANSTSTIAIDPGAVRSERANSTSTIAIDPGAVRSERANSVRPYLAKVALVLTAAVVPFVICFVMFWAGRHWPLNLERRCLNLHSTFCGLFHHQNTIDVRTNMVLAPALKDIDSVYKSTKFNGTLDYPSIYRQDPSPEVDSAWDRLELVGIMRISEEDLVKSGSSTDAVRIPADYGGGFMVAVEVHHQLHCLNFLRKSIFFNHPYYKDKAIEYTDRASTVRVHLGHCVEMLRQLLMCNADVGMISHRWIKDYPRPYPNFNTWHQCRNFEQVLDWTQDHQLRVNPGHVWQPQPGEKIFADAP